ncbi:ribonuclease HII [Methanohalophilus levihalophilus]|uniref:ribonuclease HII n=1 Tax=Methanohalophilus levihalophilus TaxID=1431282 RepID=UPI001AE3E819|nr:ribonuclease HII [Methanohalophilus levihalophilus]MBP2029738.1 ribonuclease HII [Methanohalophilus levihalophilus]
MKVAGIDEAGKGPVIGPMCIGGVLTDEENLHSIKNLGVADSKKLSPKRREDLFLKIEKYASKTFVLEISPSQIDELRKIMTMNEITVMGFSKVLENLQPDTAYVDAADVKAERFGKKLTESYTVNVRKPLTVVSEHKADDKYPIVSAASIVAKVTRDRRIEELKKSIGKDFGSGYPSDRKTKDFLDNWVKENGSLPDFVRHSWKTAEQCLENK